MNTRTKIYIAAGVAASLVAGFLVESGLSGLEVRRLERVAEAQKARADALESAAAAKETEAAGYREKTEYLERRLASSEAERRRQDEQLEKLDTAARDARTRVARARREQPAATDADALCKQLADVGHECRDHRPSRE